MKKKDMKALLKEEVEMESSSVAAVSAAEDDVAVFEKISVGKKTKRMKIRGKKDKKTKSGKAKKDLEADRGLLSSPLMVRDRKEEVAENGDGDDEKRLSSRKKRRRSDVQEEEENENVSKPQKKPTKKAKLEKGDEENLADILLSPGSKPPPPLPMKEMMKPKKEDKFTIDNREFDELLSGCLGEEQVRQLVHAGIVKRFQRVMPKSGPLSSLYVPEADDLIIPNIVFPRPLSELPKFLLSSKMKDNSANNGSFSNLKGTPHTIILTMSAKKATEIAREIRSLSPHPVAKLFAKHMKVSEQKGFLGSHECDYGVGTPSRVASLVSEGDLKLDRCKLLVIDMKRDMKSYNIFELRDVGVQLFQFLKEFVVPKPLSLTSSSSSKQTQKGGLNLLLW